MKTLRSLSFTALMLAAAAVACSRRDEPQPAPSDGLKPAAAHGTTQVSPAADGAGLKFTAPTGWV